jgi:amino acid transporter
MGVETYAESSERERGKLRRELRRFDTIFFLISAMVVVDTIGAISVGGAQAFTWLIVLFLFFFVPSALASAELGAALPEEGGAYVWVRRSFGRYPAGVTSLLYWAGTPMWLGGSVTVVAIAVFGRFFGELSRPGMVVFGTVFILVATIGAVVPLRYGKWVPTSGAISQIALLAFFTVTVVIYGTRHGIHGIAVGDFAPSYLVFIAIVPILLYSFVGIELPTSAAEEMVDPRRDIPFAIGRAGVGQLLMYGVPILAVLLVLPPSQVTSLHGLIDAMKTVFTVYGGTTAADGSATLTGAGAVVGAVCAVLFIWILAASGSAWIIGAGRAQAAACLEGAGPAWLGHISSRTGVPVRIGLVSGAVALLMMAVDLAVTGGDGQRYFSAALTLAVSLIVLAYLVIFPTFVALRIKEPGLERPFRVPGGIGVAWLITLVATGWALLAAVCLLWPGFGTADPDAALPAGFAGDRAGFELLVLGPIVALLVVHSLFYVVHDRRQRAAQARAGIRLPQQRSAADAALTDAAGPSVGVVREREPDSV